MQPTYHPQWREPVIFQIGGVELDNLPNQIPHAWLNAAPKTIFVEKQLVPRKAHEGSYLIAATTHKSSAPRTLFLSKVKGRLQ